MPDQPVQPAYRYRAKVLRVIDADTFVVQVDCGFYMAATINVRLNGVNAPEKNTVAGKKAKGYVERLFKRRGSTVVVETSKSSTGTDEMSFTRWIADVWIGADRVADLLLAQKHAVPFDPKVDKWTREATDG